MKDRLRWLLVDNSNTRTKFALWNGAWVADVRVLPTSEVSVEQIQRLLEGWSFDSVCLCSVVPMAAEEIRRFAQALPVHELCASVVRGVDFSAYPGISTLGADRVANVLAALKHAPLPLVAVDAGTATTFDVVVEEGGQPRFMGGVIAPGLRAVAGCLQSRTAMLPVCDPQVEGPVIGRNTAEALSSAITVGYPGMMESILDGIEAELGCGIHVVVTGGDAAWLVSRLRRQCELVPDLTMQGIAQAALLMN